MSATSSQTVQGKKMYVCFWTKMIMQVQLKKKRDLGNLGEEKRKRNSNATVAAFYTKIKVTGKKSDNNIIVLYSLLYISSWQVHHDLAFPAAPNTASTGDSRDVELIMPAVQKLNASGKMYS